MIGLAAAACDNGTTSGGNGGAPAPVRHYSSVVQDIAVDDAFATDYPDPSTLAYDTNVTDEDLALVGQAGDIWDLQVFENTDKAARYIPTVGDNVSLTLTRHDGTQVPYTGQITSYDGITLKFKIDFGGRATIECGKGSFSSFRGEWINKNGKTFPVKVKLTPKKTDVDDSGTFGTELKVEAKYQGTFIYNLPGDYLVQKIVITANEVHEYIMDIGEPGSDYYRENTFFHYGKTLEYNVWYLLPDFYLDEPESYGQWPIAWTYGTYLYGVQNASEIPDYSDLPDAETYEHQHYEIKIGEFYPDENQLLANGTYTRVNE